MVVEGGKAAKGVRLQGKKRSILITYAQYKNTYLTTYKCTSAAVENEAFDLPCSTLSFTN